ncbi:hypothetical protein G7046_g1195 [Stylonectria norvegica]|nr:hypothetical protein G7046_g1195 [Stylonectria norvegica]
MSRSLHGFNPDKDIPDLAGKVIFLTGGTGGIGKTAVLEFARHNAGHIYFTGRNQKAADEVLAAIPAGVSATFISCDLTSLESVKQAAAKFTATSGRLDIFIANAGIMAVPAGLTKDGFEIQFGTNHVGNSALALRLLPTMLQTAELPGADVRFINLTSTGFGAAPKTGIEFAKLRTKQEDISMGSWGRYGQSKLANILFANELGRRYPKITSASIHPGVVRTELVTSLGFLNGLLVTAGRIFGGAGKLQTPEQGCYNTVWGATSPDLRSKLAEDKVTYFEPVGKAMPGNALCADRNLAKELWEWTEKAVGVKG